MKGLDFKDPLPDKDPILDEIFSDNSIREERDKGTSHFPPLNGASTNHHHAHSAAANQHSHSAHAHETPNAATSSVDTYGSPQAGAIDEYGSPQAAPVSNYSPPSYNVPSYNAPSYNAPSYNAPSYNAPSYNPPSYNAPSYNCKGQVIFISLIFWKTLVFSNFNHIHKIPLNLQFPKCGLPFFVLSDYHTLKMSGIELICDHYFMNVSIYKIRLKIKFRKLFERWKTRAGPGKTRLKENLNLDSS